MGGFYLKLG